MSFTIFQNKKTPLQAIKTTSLKSRNIAVCPKWLTHGFGPKLAIFPTSFFQAIQARKMCFTIFQNETTPFQALKTRSSKSQKIGIFPKGLTNSFGPKMAIFPTSFFQAKQVRKMSFTTFQNEKNPFLGYKNKNDVILARKNVKIKNSKSYDCWECKVLLSCKVSAQTVKN